MLYLFLDRVSKFGSLVEVRHRFLSTWQGNANEAGSALLLLTKLAGLAIGKHFCWDKPERDVFERSIRL